MVCSLWLTINKLQTKDHRLQTYYMQIRSAQYVISSALVTQCPKPDRPEYAFIGRSNVGKSSLINMVCNRKVIMIIHLCVHVQVYMYSLCICLYVYTDA